MDKKLWINSNQTRYQFHPFLVTFSLVRTCHMPLSELLGITSAWLFHYFSFPTDVLLTREDGREDGREDSWSSERLVERIIEVGSRVVEPVVGPVADL